MRIKKGLILRRIGKEHVIISPEKGMVDMTKVYTLNDTAAWLWEELVNVDFTAGQMEDLLMQRYEISRERVHVDVQKLIELFKAQGLIEE